MNHSIAIPSPAAFPGIAPAGDSQDGNTLVALLNEAQGKLDSIIGSLRTALSTKGIGSIRNISTPSGALLTAPKDNHA